MRSWYSRLRRPLARAGLYIVIALSFALRVYRLDASSLWWDESLSYVRAVSDLGRILSNQITIQALTTRDQHPPLYFLLLHFTTGPFGVSEYALRFLSVMAGVAALPLIYQVTRLWFNARVAWLATALAGLSPFYVYYAQEARPYTLVLFWSLLSVYALGKWGRELERGAEASIGVAPGGRKSPPHSPLWRAWLAPLRSRYFLLYVAATVLTLFTHYLSFLLLPFHALLLYTFSLSSCRAADRARVVFRGLALALTGAFLIAFPLIPLVSPNLAGPDAGGPQFVPWLVLFRDLLNSFSAGVTVNLDQVWGLDLAFLALYLLGAVAALASVRLRARAVSRLQATVLILGYVLLPAIALQLGSYIRPMYMNSRHLLAISPGFYIGAAAGLAFLARRWKTLPFALAGGAVVAAAAALSLGNLYFNPAYAKDDHRGWVEYLEEHMRPGDGMILVSPQAETLLRYYAPDLLPWISLPTLVSSQEQQSRADLQAISAAYQKWPRIWLLELHAPVADAEGHIAELLRRWGTRLDRVYFHGQSTEVILSDFEADTPFYDTAPSIAHPAQVAITDRFRFLGYDLPRQAPAGERSTVKLYWRLDAPTEEDLAVSLVVKNAAGEVWGRSEGLIVGNLWPTSHWPTGQIATQFHDIALDPAAPPGTYQAALQVYRSNSGERVGSVVPLGSLEVTRPAAPLDPSRLVFTRRLDMQFGALTLVGYNLDDAEARPGDTRPVTLYFRVNGPAPETVRGRIALTPAWAPFWPLGATAFDLDTRGRDPGDYVRAIVPLRLLPDLRAGDYLMTLALEGLLPPWEAGFALNGVGLGPLRVAAIARQTDLPASARPLQARFGEGIELAGYTTARDGSSLHVTLYWRSRAPVTTSYKVFVHVLDVQNHVVAQRDALPIDGARPTTSWASGEVIADPYVLELPASLPAGTYPIEVGMYDEAANTRLPAFLNDRPEEGGRILIEPLILP